MKEKISILVIAALIMQMIPVPVYAALSITDVTDPSLNPISSGVYGGLVYVFGDGVISEEHPNAVPKTDLVDDFTSLHESLVHGCGPPSVPVT